MSENYNALRERVTDAIADALEWDMPTDDNSVEDTARDAAYQALEDACIYYANVIKMWQECPAIDPEDAGMLPDNAGIIERMVQVIHESFFERDYYDARDAAIERVIRSADTSQHRDDAIAALDGYDGHPCVIFAEYAEAEEARNA